MNAKLMNSKSLTKSGIMVGLGETLPEIQITMKALHEWGVDILTIGQYLQPSRRHLPIRRYYTPQEFEDLKQYGLELGFRWIESAPLVRSSYHAIDQVMALKSD
jgi:lipoic acid synthetase